MHEAAFAPLAVALLLLAVDRKQWGWAWAAALGAYLFVQGERRRGAVLLAVSLLAFAVIVGVVIPAASDAGAYGYQDNYREALRHPWHLPAMLFDSPIKRLTAVLWVAPFALLPLASPLIVLIAPLAAVRFWSASQNHWGTIFHYSAPLAPILAMAAADGLARVGAMVQDLQLRRRTVASFAVACVVLAALLPGHQPLWALFSSKAYRFGLIDANASASRKRASPAPLASAVAVPAGCLGTRS